MGSLADEVVDILFASSFMTLATADKDGAPWVSPVEFVCDEHLSFYWVSMTDARHSHNVRVNPRAALSIYDSTQVPGVNMVQGMYGEGPVDQVPISELASTEESGGRWIRWRDAGRATPRPLLDATLDDPESPWRLYRLTPTDLYALDRYAGEESVADSRVSVDIHREFRQAYSSRIR